MSDFVRVPRNAQNEYQVRVRVEGLLFDAIIDTGMTQPDCLVGIGLDSQSYRSTRAHLRQFQRIEMRGIGSDTPDFIQVGLGRVAIEGLDDSEIETYIADVGENLVGVCYFQKLPGYEIVWDLEAGEMTIRKKHERA